MSKCCDLSYNVNRSAMSAPAHVCTINTILMRIHAYYKAKSHLNTHFIIVNVFTEDTVAKISRETQTLQWMNEWMNVSQRNIVEFEMFASCVLFSPDCHASLWSSWPAQLDWCVLGLCRPGPSSPSSSSHHISCEERKFRPAACISALRHLLPALSSSTAVQRAEKNQFRSVICIQ